MSTGILIIAVGAKNYGQLAGTLAASIRANGCELPIHLVYEEDTISRLDEQYLSFFTSKSIIPQHCITYKGNTCYIKAKAHMNELSPFENTLFLDADIIILKNNKLNEIIEQLKKVDFTVKNSGYINYDKADLTKHQWANLGEVKEHYEFTNEKIWNVHSEFIWWQKTDKMNKLFERWVFNFENIGISHIEFGGCIPDELPLWIAMAQLGINPHQENFTPIFWPMDSKSILRVSDLTKQYVGLSIGGNGISPIQKNNYDLLVTLYANLLNLRYKFFCHPKKKWVAERHTY